MTPRFSEGLESSEIEELAGEVQLNFEEKPFYIWENKKQI